MKHLITSKLFFLLIGMLLSGLTFAQQATLRGKVTSGGEALVGAAITVGRSGALTNASGEYSLSVSPGTLMVMAGFVGYKNQTQTVTVAAGETATLDFALEPGVELNEVVVIGSRSQPRTQLDSPVPVDVLDVKRLTRDAPQVTLNQILNYAAPSFSSNTQSLGDGTDHIDPASIRGLGPDQVLVLINGKRRHTSSLVNVNGTVGRGSVGTDLNAIPVSAIDRIEILRDGASAQYGSDAIAGVINIVLKSAVNHFDANVTTGGYITQSNGKNIQDGQNVQVALNYGLPLGEKGGYINFSGSFDQREPTNRGGVYNGVIYPTYPGGVDDTEGFLARTNTTREDYSLIVGQSQFRSGQFFFNAAVPLGNNAEIYSFGGLGYRRGLSPGFYRYPNDARNVLEVYPLGFMPYIGSDIYDRSVSVGIRGDVNDWHIDFSNTLGQNQFEFRVENSINASLLTASPTVFRAGGPRFTQNTFNLDFTRKFDVLSGLNLAFGGEYRFERYQLLPGDPNSYTNYGTARQVGVDATGKPILIPDPAGPVNTLFGPNGSPRPGGAQVFPGFRPENAVNANRTSIAAYGEVELNLSEAFLVDGAIRYENYSDFGSTLNGKISLRYKITDQIAVRASTNTGFRAPSLQQRYYTNTSTVFTNGVANEVGVFPNNSRAAQLVGIPSLRPEKSQSVSAGVTGNLGSFKVTVDGYFTRINDRVIFTDQFAGSNAANASEADRQLYDILLQANATRAQFFANAIDTETKGIDAVLTYSKRLGRGTFRADLAGSFFQTRQVGAVKASELLQGKEDIYFSNASRIYLERAIPNKKVNLTLTYNLGKFNVFLRNNYFGGVTEAVNAIERQQYYTPKVITDIGLGYSIAKPVRITIGSNNLFDVYPDRMTVAANSNSGQFLYSRTANQFGFNGRYVFGRVEINL